MKTLKNEFLNQLRKQRDEITNLTGKQVGALVLYFICAILVQIGAQVIALKIYTLYMNTVKKLYEKYELDFDKHTIIHIIIAILISSLIIYACAYLAGYLFGKYVLRKAFD